MTIIKCVCYPLANVRASLARQIKQLQLYRATSARVGARPNLALKASARRRALQCAMMSHAVGCSFKYLISSSLHNQNAPSAGRSSKDSSSRLVPPRWGVHARTLIGSKIAPAWASEHFVALRQSSKKPNWLEMRIRTFNHYLEARCYFCQGCDAATNPPCNSVSHRLSCTHSIEIEVAHE